MLFLIVGGLSLLSSTFTRASQDSGNTNPANSYQGKSTNITDSSKNAPEPYSANAPIAKEFSLQAAVDAADQASLAWCNIRSCISCHTNGYYLALPTKVRNRRPAEQKVYEHAIAYIESWRKDAPPGSQSIVVSACFMAMSDAQHGQGLHPVTIEALNKAWLQQDQAGHWPTWVKCDWEPFESDDHFGVTLMAVATGMAGEQYRKTERAVTGMERIKKYLSTHPPASFHQKAMLLWAAKYHKGLIERSRSKIWIEQLFSLQNADGGWSSVDLVLSQQGKAKEKNHAAKADSDGYGSGFVIYVLRMADIAATDTRIKKGIAWLKNNQRTAGYWWTQSIRNTASTPHYLTNAGTSFAIKAIILCAENSD